MSKSNCRNNKILSWKISPISNTIYSLKNKKSSYLEIQLIVLNNIPVFSYYTLLICAELDLNFFWHKEVFRLGVKFELQLSAYTTVTATATQNPSHVCNLHHSSQQCQILNTLSEARDWTCNLMVPSQIHFHWATTVTPIIPVFKKGSWDSSSFLNIVTPSKTEVLFC